MFITRGSDDSHLSSVVSIELEEDEILVHALTDEAADGTLEGGIDKRVTAIEGTSVSPSPK